MSAEAIARWNAIPMNRQDVELDTSTHSKRPRQDQDQDVDAEDSEDDNVSLVSRTPSPHPSDEMDVDKYDEYVRGAPTEVITVDTKIKSTNKGFAMLAKLGWSEGQPLGLSGDGRVDPIPFQVKNDLTGLGKMNQDFRMIETTVSQRRVLDSERQRKETEDQRKARQDAVAKQAALKSEISDTLRPFYCTLCEKQFQNVAQYDEHTNSYAHHHKARLKDMQANARVVNQEDLEKRKEKERKREEKELRKLAKAQGIKIVKPTTIIAAPTPIVMGPEHEIAAPIETKPAAFKKAGWAAVSTGPEPSNSNTGFKRSGWATVGSSASPPSQPPPPPREPTPPPPPPSFSRFLPSLSPPMFRTGGWTSLDTSGPQTISFPQASPTPLAPPPPEPPRDVPPPPSLPRYQDVGTPPGPPRQQWASIPPSNPASQPPSSSIRAPLPSPPAVPTKSGWQQWKQGSSSKRR